MATHPNVGHAARVLSLLHAHASRVRHVVLITALYLAACGAALADDGTATAAAATAETAETSSLIKRLHLDALWANNDWVAWTTLGVAVALGLFIGTVVAAVIERAAQRLPSPGWEARRGLLKGMAGPIRLAGVTIGLAIGLSRLEMSTDLQGLLARSLFFLGSIAVAWYGYNAIGALDPVLRRRASQFDTTLKNQLVPVIRKLLRTALVVIWVLFVVESVFGGDIGAWLAGLGIAGLAVSLAAQDSLKNLFGSLTILFDRPFQVGDRIKFANYDGVVTEIGFRSTKVKTLDGHLVTIPNLKIVAEPVENISYRQAIQRTIHLPLRRRTPREKVVKALEIVRAVLNEEGIREPIQPSQPGAAAPRVYFSDLAADKWNLVAVYSYTPPVHHDFMEHAERVNLRILAEFEKAGIELV